MWIIFVFISNRILLREYQEHYGLRCDTPCKKMPNMSLWGSSTYIHIYPHTHAFIYILSKYFLCTMRRRYFIFIYKNKIDNKRPRFSAYVHCSHQWNFISFYTNKKLDGKLLGNLDTIQLSL